MYPGLASFGDGFFSNNVYKFAQFLHCLVYFIEPQLVVDLLLVSRSGDTRDALGFGYSSIFVNDFEHKLDGAGSMHIVIVNALTGE